MTVNDFATAAEAVSAALRAGGFSGAQADALIAAIEALIEEGLEAKFAAAATPPTAAPAPSGPAK